MLLEQSFEPVAVAVAIPAAAELQAQRLLAVIDTEPLEDLTPFEPQ